MASHIQLSHTDRFVNRHIGPSDGDVQKMLGTLGFSDLEAFTRAVVPASIQLRKPLDGTHMGEFGLSEVEVLDELKAMALKNSVAQSYLGQGYSDCITPPVILRNILENPGWYTQYTPYQAEIAQGRLEALLNFQTLVMDLTGMEIANASLLDEGTAAAEAMAMALAVKNGSHGKAFFVSSECHPQTIAVIQTRAEALGVQVVVENPEAFDWSKPIFAGLLQYPSTDGSVLDYRKWIEKAHSHDALVILAADPLALTLLMSPGELGADIAVGSMQRFGVPMGFGGPHAAYLATRDAYKRQMPGRIVGLSKDAEGRPAARLALQTREQHIRRDKATSNICTAQVLLAVTASMYAVYHGPEGLRSIAKRVHQLATLFAGGVKALGFDLQSSVFFDTVTVKVSTQSQREILSLAQKQKINLRVLKDGLISVAFDEVKTLADVEGLWNVFALGKSISVSWDKVDLSAFKGFGELERTSAFLTHPVFNSYHSETEMLRYMNRLQSRDLSLTHSMIPLGSCTMKLNATAEMIPITWPEFGKIHPFAPVEQVQGYFEMLNRLEKMLAEITGFDAISFQPNAGSQGEYAGLLTIRGYHLARGETDRDVCLIPQSAHGTNPASAVMAGMKVVVVKTDTDGNVDVDDLRSKTLEAGRKLSALMITYPSTHGVFEERIREICELVHAQGGQVYMDGANMNAQVGLCRPADFGADVCHLNLHKTFCIPHGGGGPGMGPIGVRAHLAPYLPSHPAVGYESVGGKESSGPVSAAPFGSASILPISYAYIRMMGTKGLTKATSIAILNANHMAKRLQPHYPVLYRGKDGLVAHECILDLRPLKVTSGIEVEDVAKRLMDYGFHAPTVSFPVAGTMMIEPTESESLAEIDRFCDVMIQIRDEIREIEEGKADRARNVVKLAPHTATQVTSDSWDRPYTREKAAFPTAWVKSNKFWPSVARVDNVHGDRNLVCTCAPIESYQA